MILRCTVGLLVLLVSVNCFNPDQLYNGMFYFVLLAIFLILQILQIFKSLDTNLCQKCTEWKTLMSVLPWVTYIAKLASKYPL